MNLNVQDGNLIFSPLSLGLVLLMARLGAQGRTGYQLDRVLSPALDVNRTEEDLRTIRRGYLKVLKSIKV